MISVFILSFTLLTPCSSTSTSISDEWYRTWGSAGVEDHLKAIAIDSSDNIYCAGETVKFPLDLEKRDSKFQLIKYNSSGILQWNQTWGGNKSDYCEAIALDSSSNIYVTGFTNSFGGVDTDIALLKYNSVGMLQWNRTYGTGIEVRAGDIALDSTNNVYIAGDILNFSASSYLSCFLVKFDGSGIHQWNRTWGGFYTDYYEAIAIDSLDNIYLTGSTDSYGAGESDMFLVKYNNLGELQWNKTWGGSEDDRGLDISLDSLEKIYIAGTTKSYAVQLENTQLLREDMCLLKYDSLGELQWNRTWGGTNMDFCTAMVIDSNDNIYLAGSTASYAEVALDMCVVTYDDSGKFLWYRTWSGTTSDYGYAIALDSSENIYIGGSIKNYSMMESDMLIAKISKPSDAISGYDSLFMICLIFTVLVFLIKKCNKLNKKI